MMKPFDIEAAKAGAKVVTRDGRKVRILCTDLKAQRPIVAAILSPNGEYEYETTFFADGHLVKRQHLNNKGHENVIVTEEMGEDLMMDE